MTDFGPMLANPVSLLLGASAQLGIYIAFILATILGIFSPEEAASIAIIGGADGPTAIFLTTKLAPHLLGPIAVAAYSYMALIPMIQPPIMRALTTKKGTRNQNGPTARRFPDGKNHLPDCRHRNLYSDYSIRRALDRYANAWQSFP